jgi:hypothetical protein
MVHLKRFFIGLKLAIPGLLIAALLYSSTFLFMKLWGYYAMIIPSILFLSFAMYVYGQEELEKNNDE